MEIFRLPESLTVSDAVEASEGLPCIEFVSPDYVVFPDIPSNEASKLPNLRKNSNEEGKLKPNDPYYSVQWHLQENGTRFGQIWAHAKSFPEITVAVIDSGCDLSHPDLQDSYWKNPDEICDDGIDNDGNGYVDDCYGWDFVGRDNNPDAEKSTHGVAVAGVIAAQIDNSIGIAGICANCKIMCLRFMGAKGGKVTDEVAALDYALTKGVRISNNSYGDYGGSLAERWAVERSRKFQHLFVTSAGNNNRDTDDGKNFHTPSAYPFDNILAVGSSTAGGERAPYSNYGKFSVDILAPGTNIVTLLSGGKYTVLSGTSFAAPSVAAAAALVWSKYPTLSYLSVVDVLVNTCHTINETNEKWSRCRGILDIPMALKRAQQLTSLEEVTETVKLS